MRPTQDDFRAEMQFQKEIISEMKRRRREKAYQIIGILLAWLQSKRVFVQSTVLLSCLLAIATLAALEEPPSAEALVFAPNTPAANNFANPTYATSTATRYYVYLPLVQRASSINPQNRQQSLNLYLQQYLSSGEIPIGWTGDRNACNRGNTNRQFLEAVLRRINYFRTMAGVPAVTLRNEYNRKAQAAALMMSVNRTLNHSPTPNWLCYSSDGAEAAGSSDLFLGMMGWNAVSGYILEGGVVAHRRWILYPQTREMGTGDIPSTQNYPAANALWVFDSNIWGPRPATRNEFVAWPPPGYVPYQVVNDHWSFAYPHANFSSARVIMASGGANLPVALEPVLVGYGENTLVWIPLGVSNGGIWAKPQADTAYTVTIENVIIGGQSRSFTYDVIVFDPTK